MLAHRDLNHGTLSLTGLATISLNTSSKLTLLPAVAVLYEDDDN